MFTPSPTSSETQPASFAGCKLILVRISAERERESGREREGGRERASERGRGQERTPFEP